MKRIFRSVVFVNVRSEPVFSMASHDWVWVADVILGNSRPNINLRSGFDLSRGALRWAFRRAFRQKVPQRILCDYVFASRPLLSRDLIPISLEPTSSAIYPKCIYSPRNAFRKRDTLNRYGVWGLFTPYQLLFSIESNLRVKNWYLMIGF